MDVTIVDFPETRVAAVEHRGPPHLEQVAVRKLRRRAPCRLARERNGGDISI